MKNKKLDILIITHNYPSSFSDRQNAGVFVFDIAQELSKKAHVSIFSPGKKNSQEKIGKTTVNWFQLTKGKKLGSMKIWRPSDLKTLLGFFFAGYSKSEQVVKNNSKISFVIGMWAFPAGFYAYLIKKRFRIPYSIWTLGSDIYFYAKFPIIKQLIRKILQNATFLLADGIDLADQVEKLSGKKCFFLPSASKFDLSNKPKFTQKNTNQITLTFLGRMEKVKGPDVLLEALLKNKSILSNFLINFIGNGSLLKELREKVQKEGIGKFIKFHGNISDKKKIFSIIKNSNWLIIPSRSDSIPLVFSEAMKAQTPIIAADLPDLKYLINKYKIGLTFPLENHSKLAQIIRDLQNSKVKEEELRKNTKKVARIFSIESSAEKLYQFINKTLR